MPKELNTLTCKSCGREAELFSGVKHNQLFSDLCERCIGVLGSAELSRNYDRTWQRRHYAKDIIQPWEKAEYIKNYPQQAREHGYTDEDFRKFS